MTIAINNAELHAVLRQRPLRDPPAVADRREVRRLHARAPRVSRRCRRSPAGRARARTCLPLARTSSPVDSDIVQDISQQPIRQRFALILNELGTGLAARGSDLNAVDPSRQPGARADGQGAEDPRAPEQRAGAAGDRLRTRSWRRSRAPSTQLSDFVVQANTTSVASAARAADISRSFQLFPEFLRQLRPLRRRPRAARRPGHAADGDAGAERPAVWRASSRTWRRSPGRAARR